MNNQCEVCVIGSGAVGKATALALAQAGLQVVLLAPSCPVLPAPGHTEEVEWDSRVYALNHVARSLLSSLKVWRAMDTSRIAAVDAMAVHGDASDGPGHLGFDAYAARVDALAWIVEDRNLNEALDTALRFASGLRMINAAALTLDIFADRASVGLANGEMLNASLVIGADGAQSWVRAQTDI
eukprot:gene5542-7332_t